MSAITRSALLFLIANPLLAFSAVPVDLSQQNLNAVKAITFNPYHETADFNQTRHIRQQQTYNGYPVWGAESVKHLPHFSHTRASANGKAYLKLDADLNGAPAAIFTPEQNHEAVQAAIRLTARDYQQSPQAGTQQSRLMVYIDKDNKAHWAFYIGFTLHQAKPVYILDAQTFRLYKAWNDYKTSELQDADGGGVGGNIKMGQLVYDGQAGHLNKFPIKRDPSLNLCYLQNNAVNVKDSRTMDPVAFRCVQPDPGHNKVFWNDALDAANDGYSPNNDAIYGITFIKQMYLDWYGVAPITENGKAVPITVYTHINMDNASWEGKQGNEWRIMLGDGGVVKYPSTAIGVIAHEIAHGFTEQHSDLVYDAQSGGLNESFSDMSDQAAQYYAYNGKNNWMHDAEITKAEGKALRYLDQPSKDCYGVKTPGVNCSIDHVSQYSDHTDVHYSSGIFNRVFYLIGTAEGWDARKTFDVMVKANTDYWTPNTTFSDAACGVISAAKDYKYDLTAIMHAFDVVGVDTGKCQA